MTYKENADESTETNNDFLSDDVDELDFEEEAEETTVSEDSAGTDDLISTDPIDIKKNKALSAKERFSLKSRRAIEDHLERRRLRKELDYLFDDGFAAEKKAKNNTDTK